MSRGTKPEGTAVKPTAGLVELMSELVKVCEDRLIAIPLNRLGWLTLEEAARVMKVSTTTVLSFIRKRILPGRQVVKFAPWVIERTALNLPEVQTAVNAIHSGRRLPPTVPGQAQLTLSMGLLNK